MYRLICLYLSRLLLSVCLATFAGLAPAADDPVIAAASSLRFALDDVAARFTAETDRQLRISYGASGNLVRQIAQGAPFELFLSADEISVAELYAAGRTPDAGVVYATGRIVLYAPRGSPLKEMSLTDLGDALRAGRIERVAIAHPDYAPYGLAARQALLRAGLWEDLQEHLVRGHSAAQTAHLAASGAVQAAILPYSLALTPAIARRGRYALIPGSSHAAIRHRMVLIDGAGATARRFFDYLQTDAARTVFARYGLMPPED